MVPTSLNHLPKVHYEYLKIKWYQYTIIEISFLAKLLAFDNVSS